ncbi:hypothetical protein [Corynebacterium sp.]
MAQAPCWLEIHGEIPLPRRFLRALGGGADKAVASGPVRAMVMYLSLIDH